MCQPAARLRPAHRPRSLPDPVAAVLGRSRAPSMARPPARRRCFAAGTSPSGRTAPESGSVGPSAPSPHQCASTRANIGSARHSATTLVLRRLQSALGDSAIEMAVVGFAQCAALGAPHVDLADRWGPGRLVEQPSRSLRSTSIASRPREGVRVLLPPRRSRWVGQRRSLWLDEAHANRALAVPQHANGEFASWTTTASSRCSPAPCARSRPRLSAGR